MLKWVKKSKSPSSGAARTEPGAVRRHESKKGGRYRFLYEYLEHRYAGSVVLTFGQIEDLLGFSLPGPARVQREWWGGTEPVANRSSQSDAWILAGRTASVNLPAQCVVFERESPVASRT